MIRNNARFSIPLYVNYALRAPTFASYTAERLNMGELLLECQKKGELAVIHSDASHVRLERTTPIQEMKDVYRILTISIDLSKGACLSRMESCGGRKIEGKMKREPPDDVLEVKEYIEAEPGVSFPKTMEIVLCMTVPVGTTRDELLQNFPASVKRYTVQKEIFSVDRIRINNRFQTNDFIVEFPRGAHIYDDLMKAGYSVGDPVKNVEKELKEFKSGGQKNK